jgi:O-acetyl-ADP-ribose deacetylase (regulator of RNase III)
VEVAVIEGDLLDQPVEVIVNAWNRNVIPWWLLLPQGVSGAIKKRAGTGPFRELRRHGAIPLGGAVLTSAGRLPYKAIIHVAGINMLWRASERSIRDSVRHAVRLAHAKGFRSVAFPLIGTGSGGFDGRRAMDVMLDEFSDIRSAAGGESRSLQAVRGVTARSPNTPRFRHHGTCRCQSATRPDTRIASARNARRSTTTARR